MLRIVFSALSVIFSVSFACSASVAQLRLPQPPTFEQLIAGNSDLSYRKLKSLTPQRSWAKDLTFAVEDCAYYREVVDTFELCANELETLASQGMVSLQNETEYPFCTVYYAVYEEDLPVLVTTDSILHALHQSFENMLIELEVGYIDVALQRMLARWHEALAEKASSFKYEDSAGDVDVYLAVARNLFAGAGEPPRSTRKRRDDGLLVHSRLGMDAKVAEILNNIRSLKLQQPGAGEFTSIYGGRRAIDYSQFRPRGHYMDSRELSGYFRAMMWLGRPDTGWYVLPPDRQSGIFGDSERELRNAALLTQLIQETQTEKQYAGIRSLIEFMVGRSDNLTVFELNDLLDDAGIEDSGQLTSSRVGGLQEALLSSNKGAQKIRAQAITSNEMELYQPPPPRLFQLFGQGAAIDSYVLSKVVFDSIIYEGKKIKRMMPSGLDVAYSLGNDAVVPLLESEMRDYPYAANLYAGRQYVDQQHESYWNESLYAIWLSALRTLNRDLTSQPNVPVAFRTKAWQHKQLQTQLASWAELRHDTILYTKQSFSAVGMCDYPSGYVEPYPEFFARLRLFAIEAARRFRTSELTRTRNTHNARENSIDAFFDNMAETMEKLEALARKELAADAFSEAEKEWLRQVVQVKSCFSGGVVFSGWYPDLFYGAGSDSGKLKPIVVDIHTNPGESEVLQAGVGGANFLVVAIDAPEGNQIFVGPGYSYYEFRRSASARLTNHQWADMLRRKQAPERPEWTKEFQSPIIHRALKLKFRK